METNGQVRRSTFNPGRVPRALMQSPQEHPLSAGVGEELWAVSMFETGGDETARTAKKEKNAACRFPLPRTGQHRGCGRADFIPLKELYESDD